MKFSTVTVLALAFSAFGTVQHAVRAQSAAPTPPEPPAFAAIPAAPAAPLLPAIPAAPREPADPAMGAGHHRGGSSSHYDGPVSDCSDLHIRLHDGEKATVVPEERTLTKAEAQVLRVHEIQNGGIQVQGWDKDVYSVTACKAAAGSSDEVQRLISQIKLSVQGGDVSVSGPGSSHDDWTVYLLIRTPKSADIELTAHNGPVAFYNVDGKITAKATNGPITVKDCSGEADIAAVNGPVTLVGTGGKLRLHTENGPINISLSGSTWNGGGLVADAVNGPLSLRVPSGFQSSFVVESNGYTPLNCEASICSQARRTWDDEHRRIEYGSGDPVIRLSTKNGPVSVL
jgi:DUF4097 and DUF4098 domain-containing protein YvlB